MGINVVIVDDQDIIRLGVRQSLGDVPHITFLGGYSDVSSFCRSAAAQRTDVVLLDDSLPDTDIVQAYETVQEQCPNAAVLILGSQMSAHDIHRVIGAGALGVVCKNEPVQDMLVVGIRHAHAGQVYLSPSAALIAGRLEPSLVLTPRLDQVLHLMARGCHVQEIAQELSITDRAVYNARKRLREILEVDTNEQIVAEAVRRGLLRGDG
ncbi:MAG: response regulator transcription factor [Anaerolineae bacterium]|nr:response regulator transcription factor [Anaerolineae bacterium]